MLLHPNDHVLYVSFFMTHMTSDMSDDFYDELLRYGSLDCKGCGSNVNERRIGGRRPV